MLQEGDKTESHGTNRHSALRLPHCFVSLFPRKVVQVIAVKRNGHNEVLTDIAAVMTGVLE